MRILFALSGALFLAGCAHYDRDLMPTPSLYVVPGGPPVFDPADAATVSPEIDLLYLTDRAPLTEVEAALQYGEAREKSQAFGSVTVRIVPDLSGEALAAQSRMGDRSEDLELELGPVLELGRFPQEPYQLTVSAAGDMFRGSRDLQDHESAKQRLIDEVSRRLAISPTKEIVLYVHGFHETFEDAAFTAAELCHFLGREPLCAFFTWPASASGGFLTSYTTTTESGQYSVGHLKKAIRILARTPGAERLQLLAHSRGASVMLSAVHELLIEAIAAGVEPVDEFRIDNLVLFSPDIDLEIAGQQLSAYASDPDLVTVWPENRLPRSISGRVTIYASPDDRALLASKILFRSKNRLGRLRPEDISPDAQEFLARTGRIDLVVYEGERTDFFGHAYFTTNPRVSSDLIQMLRYGKQIGEPGRELIRTGPVSWEFPAEEAAAHNEESR